MFDLPQFVRNNIPLLVCTLGIPVFGFSVPAIGYLGYNAVRWIINTCQKTEKVDEISQRNVNKPQIFHRAKGLITRVGDLEILQDKITMGQGEYIIFHKMPNGEKKELSRKTFEKVYKILNQHSPLKLASEDCANRYELIKEKIKEVDSTLEAVFVPRTLYELVFLRKCINEDLRNKEVCSSLDPSRHRINLEDFVPRFLYRALRPKQRKCWHRCHFIDAGNDGRNNERAGVKDVAYRLNKAMVKAFKPSSEGFTHQEFSDFAENEIRFLKDHYKGGSINGEEVNDIIRRQNRGEHVEEIFSHSFPGPTTTFGYETTYASIKPMGIRNDDDAQIIRKAIALECSKDAQMSLFLFRGADLQQDSIACGSNQKRPYSLSYGTSLFAGCLFDGGATAFHYMRNQKDAYAMPVPFDQLKDSPFYVPTTNAVTQLFGHGEIFHARSKVWEECDLNNIAGMNASLYREGRVRDHLKSNLNQDKLVAQFQEYKKAAIPLK